MSLIISPKRHPVAVYEHIIRIRQRFLNDSTGRLLDHGFGNGILLGYFQDEGFDVHGVELEGVVLNPDIARFIEPQSLTYVQQGNWSLPFAADYFSVVISNQVLNFLPSRDLIQKVIQEFFRVLLPGGKLVVTIMSEDNYLFTEFGVKPFSDCGLVQVSARGRLNWDREYYRFSNQSEAIACLSNAGFVVDDVGYFDFKLLDVTCAKHYIFLAHKPNTYLS